MNLDAAQWIVIAGWIVTLVVIVVFSLKDEL